MTTFEDRERSYEAKFARDADLQFRAEARRNRLLGEWAAEGEAFRPVDDLSVAMESIDVPAALEAARASAAENGLSDADLVGIDVGPDALAQPTFEITVGREGDRGHIVVGHDRIVREVGVPR